MRKVCKHGNSKCMVLSKIRAEVVVELGWRVCVVGGVGVGITPVGQNFQNHEDSYLQKGQKAKRPKRPNGLNSRPGHGQC